MDGFVIEKPGNEEGIDSSHIIGESNGAGVIPNQPSAQITTPISSAAVSSQQTQTESSVPIEEIEEQDAVFTSPSSIPNNQISTGMSLISDSIDGNNVDGNGSAGSINGQISDETETQNPFIEPA